MSVIDDLRKITAKAIQNADFFKREAAEALAKEKSSTRVKNLVTTHKLKAIELSHEIATHGESRCRYELESHGFEAKYADVLKAALEKEGFVCELREWERPMPYGSTKLEHYMVLSWVDESTIQKY
jgi:hypothetical protein